MKLSLGRSYEAKLERNRFLKELMEGSERRRRENAFCLFLLSFSLHSDACSVEELVLQHYAQIGGWSGVHSEGSIWRSLFVLLLWEIIYDSSVPFVFQQPCQSVPIDMYSPFLYLNRKAAIEVFLESLRNGSLIAQNVMRNNYVTNFNRICPVNWSYSLDDFVAVLDGLSVASLCELMVYAAKDFRLFGKGMPDLCLWRPKGSPRLLLCEVKGPRDRLSPEQEAHLIRLNQMGVTAIVTHVREAGQKNQEASFENED